MNRWQYVRETAKRADSLWGWVFVFLLIAASATWVAFEFLVDDAHESARQTQCTTNLRQIGSALLSYERAHGRLPPAYLADTVGNPLLSWRVLLLGYLEGQNILDRFDPTQAWNSPGNATPSDFPFGVYRCPCSEYAPATSYLAVVGPNTAWPGPKGRKLSEIKNPRKTILVIEVANSGINWAEPRDLSIDQVAQGINAKNGLGISSHHSGGANALFADGHVEFLRENLDPKELARMFDVNPPENPTVDERH
jgi:prepilin-type processing-associated H-X9-DG protein